MRHASTANTRAALLGSLLFACAASAAAQSATVQTSLQQAMLRSVASSTQAVTAKGDAAAPPPSTSVASALQQLAAEAAVVFTGSVATVQPDTAGGARVMFRVERGIRGVPSGSEYLARVSAWAGGVDRYFPGERALFLLTAPSVSGFSAPVMGERGIIPLSGDALVGNLDLRWIAADVQRGSAFSSGPGPAEPVMRAAAPAASSTSADPESSSASSATNPLSLPDVHAIDRDLVFDLLRTVPAGPGQTRS